MITSLKQRGWEVAATCALLLPLVVVLSCSSPSCNRAAEIRREVGTRGRGRHVSIYDLLDNPGAYVDRTVQVLGFLGTEFERNVLVPTRMDEVHPRPGCEVWVDLRPVDALRESLAEYPRDFGLVVVEGIVSGSPVRGRACAIRDACVLLVLPEKGVSPSDDLVFKRIASLSAAEEVTRREALSWLVQTTGKEFTERHEWEEWWSTERLPELSREACWIMDAFHFSEMPSTEIMNHAKLLKSAVTSAPVGTR